MPWFSCDNCCDTIKKPKVAQHLRRCPGSSFTCIDCSRNFDCNSVQTHNSCVTEVQKYNEGATKPGGAAASGFFKDGGAPKTVAEADGKEHLASCAPWKCSLCSVLCTSEETLLAHAAGAKHKRRSNAALIAKNADKPGAKKPEKPDATGSETPAAAPSTEASPKAASTPKSAKKPVTPKASATPTSEAPEGKQAPESAQKRKRAAAKAKPEKPARTGKQERAAKQDQPAKAAAEPAQTEQSNGGSKPSKKQKKCKDSAKGGDANTEPQVPTAQLLETITHKLKKKGTMPLEQLAASAYKGVSVNGSESNELIKLLSGPQGKLFKVEVTLA